MNGANRENFIEAIYTEAIANGGDQDFVKLINQLDDLLPNDQKVLKYQLLDAVIRFTIEKANELNILKS
jgi:hypothetical protein